MEIEKYILHFQPRERMQPQMLIHLTQPVPEEATIKEQVLGSYKWIIFNEISVTTLAKWKSGIRFCPYRPATGKWIVTCKDYLNKVN